MISVLIVDDEPELLEVARLQLEKTGSFSVDTCQSATGALSVMAKKRYDAIIADYHMPVMNGLELLKELKAKGDSTPFIMLTGAGPEDVVIEALNAGATFYLQKGRNLDAPFSDLTQKLHLAVRKREGERNLQLFSAISRHDLLNKVAALSGYVELVRAHTDDGKILNFMIKQQMILSTLRDQIQFIEDYEKVGVQKPCWQPIIPTIQKSASILPSESVTITVSDLDPIEVYADPLLVKAFYNLIDNTLRHGRHVTSVRISSRKTNDDLTIIYEDDGIGIPEADKESIFIRGKGKNTGLGLFLIREILSITGITIRETGIAGKGARFEINVPDVRYRASTTNDSSSQLFPS
jgi:signal transduction histidine kinase